MLVGGPTGEKGNKGETVSEQLDVSNRSHTFPPFLSPLSVFCSYMVGFPFRVTEGLKVFREKRVRKVRKDLQGSRYIT